MMNPPFTNIHTHVFNSACAPDRFLKIIPINFVRRFPGPIKTVIDSKVGRVAIHNLFKAFVFWRPDKRSELDKYISFLDVGTNATQQEVFETALETGVKYDSAIRIVGLTMNMDFMDSSPSKNQISFTTQLEFVKDIKKYYPKNFFPFLGIDPRHLANNDLLNWAKNYFERGIKDNSGKTYPYFCGLKLYPALGFFPFDPRLKELYAYAEKNSLPIITHCTRSGSLYIGEEIEELIPAEPEMILPSDTATPASKDRSNTARESIIKRVACFRKKGWIKNNKYAKNDEACDLFGHPENYITLLETFPNLKICLAHMGGTTEIFTKVPSSLKTIRDADRCSWFEKIWEMMKIYPNLYTDISYTLSDLDNPDILSRISDFLHSVDNDGKPLSNRVLFGTDFFMTEREKKEKELYALTKNNLTQWFDTLTRTNPHEFLKQPF